MPNKSEKTKAYNKAWAKANPEKVKASQKAYREANREKIRAYHKAWAKANPENICKLRARDAAKKRAKAARERRDNPEKVRAKERLKYLRWRQNRLLESLPKRPHADTAPIRLRPERAKAKIREKVKRFKHG